MRAVARTGSYSILTIGGSGQILEVKSQRLFQIRYGFLFRRTVTSQSKIGAARDINTAFLGDHIIRAPLIFLGFHGNKSALSWNNLWRITV